MIYLKRFNESKEDVFLKELQKFCNDNLAYLIDAGFVIVVREFENDIFGNEYKKGGYAITIMLNSLYIDVNSNTDKFKWSDIQDDFIPFYTILKNKYELEYVTAFNRETGDPIQTNNYILISGWNALPDSRIDDFDSESSNNISFVKILVKGYK